MRLPPTSAAIRRITALLVVFSVALIALGELRTAESRLRTSRQRAEAAAVEYLSSIDWFRNGLGMSRTAEAKRSADGGWLVFVDESGLLVDEYGSHCLVELDENFEVALFFPGA